MASTNPTDTPSCQHHRVGKSSSRTKTKSPAALKEQVKPKNYKVSLKSDAKPSSEQDNSSLNKVRFQKASNGAGTTWSTLSNTALARIFSFMSEEEFLQARFVCKNWAKAVKLGSELWLRRCFFFEDVEENEKTDAQPKALQFMKTFGGHMKHMEVYIGEPKPCPSNDNKKPDALGDGIAQKVSNFLHGLPNTVQLDSFAIWGLHNFHNEQNLGPVKHIVKALCHLLEKQPTLSRLGFSECWLEAEDSVTLLTAIVNKNNGKLQEQQLQLAKDAKVKEFSKVKGLALRDFFCVQWDITMHQGFLHFVFKLESLSELALSFGYMNDEFLTLMAVYLKNLKLLVLSQLFIGEDVCHVTTEGWRTLKSSNPNLKVSCMLSHGSNLQCHVMFLNPKMPLAQIKISPVECCKSLPLAMALSGEVMKYLGQNFASTLTSFHLQHYEEEYKEVWKDEKSLLNLVKMCKALTQLRISFILPANTIAKLHEANPKLHLLSVNYGYKQARTDVLYDMATI